MTFDIGYLVSVLVGGLLVFAGQWFASRQSAKVETQKMTQEKLREERRDIVRFREERTRPVFEALDRAATRWDADSFFELLEATGYEGETVDRSSEEYKQRRRELKREYFERMRTDISLASVIHEPNLRKVVTQVLWQSTEPESSPRDGSPTLQDAYLELEKWIFNP